MYPLVLMDINVIRLQIDLTLHYWAYRPACLSLRDVITVTTRLHILAELWYGIFTTPENTYRRRNLVMPTLLIFGIF